MLKMEFEDMEDFVKSIKENVIKKIGLCAVLKYEDGGGVIKKEKDEPKIYPSQRMIAQFVFTAASSYLYLVYSPPQQFTSQQLAEEKDYEKAFKQVTDHKIELIDKFQKECGSEKIYIFNGKYLT